MAQWVGIRPVRGALIPTLYPLHDRLHQITPQERRIRQPRRVGGPRSEHTAALWSMNEEFTTNRPLIPPKLLQGAC